MLRVAAPGALWSKVTAPGLQPPKVADSRPGEPARRPRWARPGLAALLLATAVLYVWGLASAGWANQYYAAAVQAGTQNWKALLFASLDPGNAVTVDKPPAALWIMALSGRIFGFSAWSMLVPQALMGVGAVALLYATVRRCSGPAAGLLAGAGLALTPVVALMFRYNNPDALMVLLVVVAAYAVVRALQSHSTRLWSAGTAWLVLAGVAMGFGFLAKMGQAFLVLPGLALAVLIAASGSILVRLGKLVVAGVALAVSAGWYVLLVQLWPAGSRPYIAGSNDNSLWQLAIGYNGLNRVFGNGNHGQGGGGPQPGSAANSAVHHGGMGGPGGMGGHSGITRLFQDTIATEFGWLLPLAVIGLIAGLWLTWRRPRTDLARGGLILWGVWLIGTAGVLTFMSRQFHTYYTIEIVPALAALAGIGVAMVWRHRGHAAGRATLALMSAASGAWVFVLLDHTPHWLPWLRWAVLVVAVAAAVLLALGERVRAVGLQTEISRRRLAAAVAAVAVVGALAGPAAYTVQTVALTHSGGGPYSGPVRAGRAGWGNGGANTTGDTTQLDSLLASAGNRWAAAAVGSHDVSPIELRTGASLMAIGGFSGRDNTPTLSQFQQDVANGSVHYFLNRDQSNDNGGGPGNGQVANAGTHARTGGHGTAGRGAAQGSGAHSTGAQRTGTHNAGGQGPGGGGREVDPKSAAGQITAWVKAHYTPQHIDGYDVYDLTAHPKA